MEGAKGSFLAHQALVKRADLEAFAWAKGLNDKVVVEEEEKVIINRTGNPYIDRHINRPLPPARVNGLSYTLDDADRMKRLDNIRKGIKRIGPM